VGATTFCGSVCRVISVVVTVCELLDLPQLILPLCLANLMSNFWANTIGPSFFDSILLLKRVPGMPTLIAAHCSHQEVTCLLRPAFMELCLPRFANVGDIEKVERCLERFREKRAGEVPSALPIVEDSGLLVGAICEADLSYLRSMSRKPTKSGTQSFETNDLLSLASKQKILVTPLRVSTSTSLKQAYLEARVTHKEGDTLFVVDHGVLKGLLPYGDLIRLAPLK